MPRRLLPLLAVVLWIAPLPATASAATGYTAKALTFNVVVGPNNDTRCTVDAELYTPNGVSHSNPAPAILATNGFGGSKDDFTTLGPSYAKRGYVFLAYSGLGFGKSGCKIELDDPDWDGKAGKQLVDFLGGSRAATDGTRIDYVIHDARAHDGRRYADDPRVGMIGGSYGGEIQFSVAGQDPRVDALNPQITWNDLSYSLTPNNTDFVRGVTYNTPGVVKADWPVLFFGLGVGDGIQETLANGDTSHAGQCPNFDPRVCPSLVSGAATGYPDATTLDLLRHASVSTYMSRIRIPTFLAQGEHDTLFDEQEAVATYEALRGQGTPVKMLWRSSGHSGGSLGKAENDETNLESAYESRMELEWFDYYLRGIGDPPRLDFSFFRDYAPYTGDAAPAVGETPSYPAGTDHTLYLSGTDALVRSRADVKAGAAQLAAVSAAPTSTGGGLVDIGAIDAPGTSVSFTTPPLGVDTVVAGVPELTVRLSAPTFAQTQGAGPAGKLVLFAKLLDVNPSGAGSAVLPDNLVSAVRVADVTKPVRIELPGIVHRFARGHELRLVLSTSDAVYKGNDVSGPVTIAVDSSAPSTLTIPTLGAQAGPTGSGPGGTTPFAASKQAPKPQHAGLGGPRRPRAAAVLPGASACRRAGTLRVRLLSAPRGDRLASVTVTANGRRVLVLRGRRVRRLLTLRSLPRRIFRLTVTVRTARGRTFTSARTYAGCSKRRAARRSGRRRA